MNKIIGLLLLSASLAAGQTSGLSSSGIPVPPAGAQLYANLQGVSGWVADVVDAGACAGTGTVTAGIASPSLSGSAIKFSINSTAGTCPANSLYYLHQACPTSVPGGCVATGVIHILEDYYLYIPSTDVGIQAIENDPDLYDGTNEYFNSRQCDSFTGKWRLWNMGTNAWITTAYPCTMLSSTNTWHHMREYSTISRITGVSTYQSFEYDGTIVWSNLGDAFPPKTNGTSAKTNFEVQMDLNTAAGTSVQFFIVDKMNAWIW